MVLASALLTLFTATAAQASTRFDKVMALYESGRTPTEVELTGAFSGRCFADKLQFRDDPFGGLLIIQKYQTNKVDAEDAGPLFPAPVPRYALQATMVVADDQPRGFDNLTSKQIDLLSLDSGSRLDIGTGFLTLENKRSTDRIRLGSIMEDLGCSSVWI